MHLKTLGHPALRRADGARVGELRRKDLALLVYLCLEAVPLHARARLAALLWGDSPEERARHSLTQALGRLIRALPPGTVAPEKDSVRWAGGLECDALALLRGTLPPEEAHQGLPVYAGPFLEGFDPGPGAQDFCHWSDRRREELRRAALRLLERAGEQAEDAREWARALHLGERAVEIDPWWEQGHRRVLRALAARGERNAALRHYQAFEAWLAQEVGSGPDPDTRALAARIRASDAPAAPPVPPSPPAPAPGPPAAAEADPPINQSPAPDPPAPPAAPREERWAGWRMPPWPLLAVLVSAAVAVGTLMATWSRSPAASDAPEPLPAHGESVRLRGTGRMFLAFGETLYEYPDSMTLCVCSGWHPNVVREVRDLPPWPRQTLPSVRRHPWMGTQLPVVSDHPQDKTAYVAVGCVLPGVPDPPTLDSIFGSGALKRMLEVPDSVLRRLPRAFVARGHPVRPAGTLIRDPEGRLRWITYHGGALRVDPDVLRTYCRSPDSAVSVSAREFRYYRAWGRLKRSSVACEAGR